MWTQDADTERRTFNHGEWEIMVLPGYINATGPNGTMMTVEDGQIVTEYEYDKWRGNVAIRVPPVVMFEFMKAAKLIPAT